MKKLALLAGLLPALSTAGVILMPLTAGEVLALQSLNSNDEAVIRFTNLSPVQVDISEIDDMGVQQFAASLFPGEMFDVLTFLTHPFLVQDTDSGTVLMGFLAETKSPHSDPDPDFANITFGVPEPSALLLSAGGLVLLTLAGRRRRLRPARR